MTGVQTCALPSPIDYAHQPRRGIAAARNAALDAALSFRADWIAFIDDDEIAEPDWIAALMAPEYRHVAVLVGPTLPIYPADAPFWCTHAPKALKPEEEGKILKTATTGNVRFHASIARAGLRFNEAIGLMGGEDQEFFSEAYMKGAEIRRTLKAIVHETVHPQRLTYRAQIYRAYWCAASDIRKAAILKGWSYTIAHKLHTIPLQLLFGMLEVAASPLFRVIGLRAFKRRALAGGKKVAKGAGRAAGMLGSLPQPYAKVVGQ